MDATYYFDYKGHSYKITFVQDRKDIKKDTYFVDFSVWHEGYYSFNVSFGYGREVFDKIMTYVKNFKGNRFKIRPSSDSRYRLFRIWLKHYVNDFNIEEYMNEYGGKNFLLIKKNAESVGSVEIQNISKNSRMKKFKDFIFNKKI